MKKITFLLFLLLTTFPFTIFAHSEQGSDIKIRINGQVRHFNEPPLIQDGTTLVPMRSLFETLKMQVDWNSKTNEVEASNGKTQLLVKKGESQAYVNGMTVKLTVPPANIGGVTYIPLRFVSESIGAIVGWNNELRTVFIKTKQDIVLKNSSRLREHQHPEQKVVDTFEVVSSAYHANCKGCSGITYTGINLLENPDKKVISVDPDVIPLGTKVHVEGYGYAIAGDIGSNIKGKRIDVFIPDEEKVAQYGLKTVQVKILK